jgi:hypothetical protein
MDVNPVLPRWGYRWMGRWPDAAEPGPEGLHDTQPGHGVSTSIEINRFRCHVWHQHCACATFNACNAWIGTQFLTNMRPILVLTNLAWDTVHFSYFNNIYGLEFKRKNSFGVDFSKVWYSIDLPMPKSCKVECGINSPPVYLLLPCLGSQL